MSGDDDGGVRWIREVGDGVSVIIYRHSISSAFYTVAQVGGD